MKVWIINQYANAPFRAGGTRHHALAKGLLRLGLEVEVIAWDRTYLTGTVEQIPTLDRTECEDVPFTFIPTPSGKIKGRTAGRIGDMLAYAKALRKHLRDRTDRPDAIYGSTPTLFVALVAYREARRRGVPFVLEVRDIWPQTLIDLGGYSPWHPGVLAFGAIERFLYRRADHIVSLLPKASEHIARRGGSAEHVTWIPNGIDLHLVAQVANDRPEPERSGDRPFVVKYAGAHGLANALDAILDTAKILKVRHPNRYRFEMIGHGHDKDRLVQRVIEEGIENVVFQDPVPKSEVHGVLADADALIINIPDRGLYRFGISPNKLFDYLAVARPLIFSSTIVNNPVQESGAGICVPADDAEAMASALERLAAMSPEERVAMGARGRAYVEEHHDMKELAKKLETVLERVVDPA